MATIIPIPINLTQTRDCIIHEGARYCESEKFNLNQLGFSFLVVFVSISWFLFLMWIFDKYFDLHDAFLITLGVGVGLPLLVGSIIFLFN